MRISDWSSDVCSSDLTTVRDRECSRCVIHLMGVAKAGGPAAGWSGAGPRAAEDVPEAKVYAVDRVAEQNDAAAAVQAYVLSHQDRRDAQKAQLEGGLGGRGGGKHGDVDRVERLAPSAREKAEGGRGH